MGEAFAAELGHKLKQYIDAKFEELATRGSGSKAGANEEAQLWVQELEEEINSMTNQ